LTFLKEQVLPKTVKLISLKTIKKVKEEEKRDKVNLLSCVRPGKSKKRYVPLHGSFDKFDKKLLFENAA